MSETKPEAGAAVPEQRSGTAKSAEDRVHEQLVHDLNLAYEKRRGLEEYRPPIWLSLRFMGLILVFIAAFSWYTRTETGLTIGMILFIIGALLIMVPRGSGFSSILRWDGGLKIANPLVELKNLDDQIAALERALERIEAERSNEKQSDDGAS